jgi:glycosyltransferase involved in cell wall biosynthesis
MVHIHYFDYFSAVPWLARTQGVNTVVFEQLNSGLLKARAWRRRLIQLRATVATYPITRVIAISDFIKQLLVESGVDEAKIRVRYLGVDTQRFSPNPAAREDLVRAYNIQPDEIVVSTIAFLRPFKDPDTIVKACGILEQRGVKVRMFVAGDGAMLGELKELAVKCGVAERTHWLGFCPDPTSLLQASDIFVLASIGEAFGFVLCEAMACGVPVVGSRIGAIPEVVEEGRTGFLATPQDPMAFAEAIERLAKDQQSRRRMGLNGIERVRANFDVNLYVRNTLQIYESLSRT